MYLSTIDIYVLLALTVWSCSFAIAYAYKKPTLASLFLLSSLILSAFFLVLSSSVLLSPVWLFVDSLVPERGTILHDLSGGLLQILATVILWLSPLVVAFGVTAPLVWLLRSSRRALCK